VKQKQTNTKTKAIITHVSSSASKSKKKWAIVVEPDYCKSCGICIEFCPTQVLEFSDERNSIGGFYPVVVDPEKCTNCRMCEMRCPDFAIFLTEIPEDTEKEGEKIEEES
jgi:2-oxoglutarate ferredoxin oxidoreductase subunit delta